MLCTFRDMCVALEREKRRGGLSNLWSRTSIKNCRWPCRDDCLVKRKRTADRFISMKPRAMARIGKWDYGLAGRSNVQPRFVFPRRLANSNLQWLDDKPASPINHRRRKERPRTKRTRGINWGDNRLI